MSIGKDSLGALFMLLFGVAYAVQIPGIPEVATANTAFTARSMPAFLAAVSIVLSLMLLVRPGDNAPAGLRSIRWSRLMLFCALMWVYAILLRPVGFIASTMLFLLASMWMLGERRTSVLVGVAAGVTFTFWLLLSYALGVYLPPLPDWIHA